MQKIKTTYLAFIVAFLYAPIVVLIAQSFNASRYRGQWTGFTWEWYEKLIESEDIINAFSNTLTIGVTSALLATLLALVTALGMRQMGRQSRMLLRGLANVPLLNADIVTGISLMLLFLGLGLKLGYDTILLSHIVISALLGGNKVLLVGNIIEQEFTAAYDWQLGSALSMVLMVFIILNILLEAFTENGETGKQAKKGARP